MAQDEAQLQNLIKVQIGFETERWKSLLYKTVLIGKEITKVYHAVSGKDLKTHSSETMIALNDLANRCDAVIRALQDLLSQVASQKSADANWYL